jgi:hypothetical protein
MKLLLCANCADARALTMRQWTVCRCGESRGRYLDGINAVLEGAHALALGFNDGSFEQALSAAGRDREGSIKRTLGQEFVAFVIPWNAATVGRMRECPCGEARISAFPDQGETSCACGRYALRMPPERLQPLFANIHPKPGAPRKRRLKRP